MKNEQGTRRPDSEDENEHDKHRRIKIEQERILRKQLCHFRPAEPDECVAETAIPFRYKD